MIRYKVFWISYLDHLFSKGADNPSCRIVSVELLGQLTIIPTDILLHFRIVKYGSIILVPRKSFLLFAPKSFKKVLKYARKVHKQHTKQK